MNNSDEMVKMINFLSNYLVFSKTYENSGIYGHRIKSVLCLKKIGFCSIET